VNDTLTITRRPGRLRRSEATAVAVAAVLFALLVLIVSPLLATASTVPELAIDNRTPWPLSIGIRSDSGGWVPIGVASAKSGTTFTETPDPGERWQVRYTYGGIEVVSSVQRSEVATDGWTISVPAELQEALEAAGTPDAPPRGS
jgi:hypothetical protein